MKEEVKRFLRNIGNDINDDGSPPWVECEGQNKEDPEGCPEHQDCGICRFEYMEKKGWLSPATQQK